MTGRVEVVEIDYIARIAAAWDGRGNWVLMPPTEHQVLLKFAGLPAELHVRTWAELTGEERRRLVAATRRILQMAQVVGWVYGSEAQRCH